MILRLSCLLVECDGWRNDGLLQNNPAPIADQSAVGAMNRPLRTWPDLFVKVQYRVPTSTITLNQAYWNPSANIVRNNPLKHAGYGPQAASPRGHVPLAQHIPGDGRVQPTRFYYREQSAVQLP